MKKLFLTAAIVMASISHGATAPISHGATAPSPRDSATCSITPPGPGYNAGDAKFILSNRMFSFGEDVVGSIKKSYGDKAALADWVDLNRLLKTREDLSNFFELVGIPVQTENGPCKNFLVSNRGTNILGNFWLFIARHDGHVPPDWLSLDSIANHTIDLGRWSHPSQALVVIRNPPRNETPAIGASTDSFHAQAAVTAQPAPAKPLVSAQLTKRALVIGIDGYSNLGPSAQLERAVADAEAVGGKLATLGFHVTRLTSPRQSTLAGLLRGFEAFKKTIAPNDMVVLFYAGHGMGLSDGTYLLPADVTEASLEVESMARRAAINENELTDGLRLARASIVVAVIDACRNDLFSRAMRRSVGNERGLRPVESEGIFKIYSASEGQTALDRLPGGDGSQNSVFTRVLLKAIGTPGLDLNRLGAAVRDEVHELARSADHQQTPAVYDKLIGSTRVYFMPETAAADGRAR